MITPPVSLREEQGETSLHRSPRVRTSLSSRVPYALIDGVGVTASRPVPSLSGEKDFTQG